MFLRSMFFSFILGNLVYTQEALDFWRYTKVGVARFLSQTTSRKGWHFYAFENVGQVASIWYYYKMGEG